MNKTILVVAAHADDEVLGCGGTIARHVSEGDRVYVAFMADGVGARVTNVSNELRCRNQARDKALRILGVMQHQALDFPDNLTLPCLLSFTQSTLRVSIAGKLFSSTKAIDFNLEPSLHANW